MEHSDATKRHSSKAKLPSTIGPYAVVALLGRGAMANAFLALSMEPSMAFRPFVIKCLRASIAEDPVALSTFCDEGALAARFSHGNLTPAFDMGTTEKGLPYIAFDYREGQTLKHVDRAAKSSEAVVPNEFWARAAEGALHGLQYAHDLRGFNERPLNLVHRDISPDNILVGYDGRVSLIDFGVARLSANLSHTDVGVMKGKIVYMAPEFLEKDEYTARSDIYSMGVVLWELVTRRSLSADLEETSSRLLASRGLPRARSIVPEVHPALEDILARAVDREPRRRFSTAAEMATAIQRYRVLALPLSMQEAGRWVSELSGDARKDLLRRIEQRIKELRAAGIDAGKDREHKPLATKASAAKVVLPSRTPPEQPSSGHGRTFPPPKRR